MVYCRRLSLWSIVKCFCVFILLLVIYLGSKSNSLTRESRFMEIPIRKPENYVFIKEPLPEPEKMEGEMDGASQEKVNLPNEPVDTVQPDTKSEDVAMATNTTVHLKMKTSNAKDKIKVAMKSETKTGKPTTPKNLVKDEKKKKKVKLRTIVSPGENVQVGDLDIFINTAVYYDHYPSNQTFNVVLNGWASLHTPLDFKCCLTGQEDGTAYTEAPARVHNIYKQYVVELQHGEFYCSLQKRPSASLDFVTLVRHSCGKEASGKKLMKIERPRAFPGIIGVCLKVVHGSLNAEKIVEWFEFMRYMGIPKVFTYHNQVEPAGMKVLNYYKTLGFLDMQPIYPAISRSTERNFTKPKSFKQFWVDNVVAINGCKHRMSGFDYVMTLGIDQFIFPKGKVQSFPDIIQELMKREPKAGAFRFDQHIAVMNWNASRKSPLHVSKYLIRTRNMNYGNNLTATPGWIFVPRRTHYIGKDQVYPLHTFKSELVPHEMYTMLQYRVCDKYWPRCEKEQKIAEHGMLKYEHKLIDRILKLPLLDILTYNVNYVNYMKAWRRKHKV